MADRVFVFKLDVVIDYVKRKACLLRYDDKVGTIWVYPPADSDAPRPWFMIGPEWKKLGCVPEFVVEAMCRKLGLPYSRPLPQIGEDVAKAADPDGPPTL